MTEHREAVERLLKPPHRSGWWTENWSRLLVFLSLLVAMGWSTQTAWQTERMFQARTPRFDRLDADHDAMNRKIEQLQDEVGQLRREVGTR
jgi:uncharacterized protein YlxW (UPF0749 family)